MEESLKKNIEKKLDQLSPEALQTIDQLLDQLIRDKTESKSKEYKPKLDWAGGLSDLKEEYTSVELQKKSLEWREKK